MADNTQLNTGSGGDNIRTIQRGGSGPKTQAFMLDIGGSGGSETLVTDTVPMPVKMPSASRADTYTGTGNGTTVDMSTRPCRRFSLQVKGTGAAATAWNVLLEGSLDGTNFTTILQHSSANPLGANADGAVVWTDAGAPFLYFRSRSAATLTLGSATNIVATIAGMQ